MDALDFEKFSDAKLAAMLAGGNLNKKTGMLLREQTRKRYSHYLKVIGQEEIYEKQNWQEIEANRRGFLGDQNRIKLKC